MEIVEGLGYKAADIEQELGADLYKIFCKWFAGQTGAVSSEGELLVYKWDYDHFMTYWKAGRLAPVWD